MAVSDTDLVTAKGLRGVVGDDLARISVLYHDASASSANATLSQPMEDFDYLLITVKKGTMGVSTVLLPTISQTVYIAIGAMPGRGADVETVSVTPGELNRVSSTTGAIMTVLGIRNGGGSDLLDLLDRLLGEVA